MICWSYWTSELICLVRCLWVLARKLFETLCALESEIMSVAMTVLFKVPTPAAQISCIQRRGEIEEGTRQWSLSPLAHAVRPSIRPSAYLALSVLVREDIGYGMAVGHRGPRNKYTPLPYMHSKYYKAVATRIISLNYHHDGSWHVAASRPVSASARTCI